MNAKFTGGSLDKSRLDTLIDAVYAIALTLLVLDVKLPAGLQPSQMPEQLHPMLLKLVIYAIAFSTVALFWVCHHYYATLVIGTDFTHLMLNLAPLMLVALVPFSAAAMGMYSGSSWAVAAFTFNAALICLLYTLNWLHCRRRLVPKQVDPGLLKTMTVNAWLSLAGESVATVLAFVLPLLGIIVAALLVVSGFVAMALLEPRIMEAVKGA